MMADEIALGSVVAPNIESEGEGDERARLPPPTGGVLALIERLAIDPRVNVDTLERMFALQERLLAREAATLYNEAMNRAQEEIQPVARTAENKETHSWFAKLEAVDKAIRPIYLRHGFALSRNTVPPLTPGNIRVEISCAHSGHVEKFHREAAPDTMGPKGMPNKTALHGGGSTETYLTRYAICGIFNVVFKDQDNDGNNAATLDADHIDYILSKIPEAKAGPKFLKYVQAESVEKAGSLEAAVATIPQRNYRMAVTALEDMIAKREAADANTAP
jgi:hypothetical protein